MAAGKSSIFSSTDLQFILTFAAGMAAFWLSGRLPALIPVKALPHSNLVVGVVSITIALVAYGLGMALWAWLVLGRRRTLRAIAAAAAVAIVLALATSLILIFTSLGHIRTTTQLALLAFGLNIAYGAYYVFGWALAHKLAK